VLVLPRASRRTGLFSRWRRRSIASPWRRWPCPGCRRSIASDDELRLDGPSYTAETLDRLHARAAASQIFFITGADAFADIATWKRYPEVLELANFVVVSRPGTDRRASVAAAGARRPDARSAGRTRRP
jgi:nicotinate-nucleotide adenylyltransferase